MKRFIEGESRAQATLFPERLDDWIVVDNPVRAVDAFVDELDLAQLGFEGAEPAATGRPGPVRIFVYEAYHDDERESVCQASASSPSGRSLSLS
jgi:hypothetical protein